MILATNGRFYTVGGDRLPGGRGHGEPLRLMVDLPEGHDVADMFVHRPGARRLVASDAGRGFQVDEADVIAQTRGGRQVLNLGSGEEAVAAAMVEEGADTVAAIGQNGRLLLFPLAEVPVMARGRGVILQRHAKGGLADIKTFVAADGLTWRTGRGVTTFTDLADWQGRRAQAGRKAPRGFPRNNRFG